MAKKQIAYLEYTFIFDPSMTFQSGTRFERELADFFNSKNMEAEVIETVGNASRRVLLITKKDLVMEPPKNPPGRPLSVKGKLEQLAPTKETAVARDFKKGKFLVRKGYLKREIRQP